MSDRMTFTKKKLATLGSLLFGTVIILAVSISSNAAPMYKWKDAEGNTQYTQHPPPDGLDYSTINAKKTENDKFSSKELEKTQKFLDDAREAREKAAAEKRKAAAEKAEKKKNCKLARDRLYSWSVRPRIQEIQEDGSRVRTTEEKRQAEIQKSRDMIKEFCD